MEKLSRGGSSRNSSVELLRIVAIFLICVCHSVGPYFLAFKTTAGFLPYISTSFITCNFLVFFGHMGNTIFAICAAYFLCNSSRVNKSKLLGIIFDSFVISVSCLVGMLIAGFRFPTDIIVKQFFPTVLMTLHFITRYVLVYLFHPLINKVLNKLSFKIHTIIVLVIVISIIFVVNPVMRHIETYDISVNLFSIFLLYIIVSYFKKYASSFFSNKKNCYLIIAVGAPLFYLPQILMIFYSDSLVMQYIFIMMTGCFSPFFLLPIYSVFTLAVNHEFHSKQINYLSTCSLFVYCFHGNYLIANYVTPQYFEKLAFYFDGGPNEVLFRLLLALILFTCGYIVSIIYRESVQRLTKLAASKTSDGIDLIIDKVKISFAKHK